MTLNDLIQAAAARLKELWPGRKVCTDEIPQKADGAFFVKVTDTEQGQKLDRRQVRTVGVQILYFRADRDALAYLAWAEAMLDSFRTLAAADGRIVRLTNRKARNDESGRYYQFLFDAVLNFVEAAPVGELMEGLDAAETVKGD